MKYRIDYLGDCPHCGSENVGYILYGLDDLNVAENYRRKTGCHIRFKPPYEYDRNGINPNRFCYECNIEWVNNEPPEKIYFDDFDEYYKFLNDRNLANEQIHIPSPKKGKLIRKIKSYIRGLRGRH